eukprot:TRINITY_DN29450_c0_g1_i1.p2 TRINITY_DN29450_c0_g1~~TRINITY_DN29450_c0_g1_i1.p2  ORF type:complete len:134 (+),score=4.74 TRINITY_DN29450_c0_g1_i1:61-402(+)
MCIRDSMRRSIYTVVIFWLEINRDRIEFVLTILLSHSLRMLRSSIQFLTDITVLFAIETGQLILRIPCSENNTKKSMLIMFLVFINAGLFANDKLLQSSGTNRYKCSTYSTKK